MYNYEQLSKTFEKGVITTEGSFIDGWGKRIYPDSSPCVMNHSLFHNAGYALVGTERESNKDEEVHVPAIKVPGTEGKYMLLNSKSMSKIAGKIVDTLVKAGVCEYGTQIDPFHGRTHQHANAVTLQQTGKTDQYIVAHPSGIFIDGHNQQTSDISRALQAEVGDYCHQKGYVIDSVLPKDQQGLFIDAFHESTSDVSAAVSTGDPGQNRKCFTIDEMRIRKLTERECFRLMGVRDGDIDKIQSVGISKTQQYKLAGNSIVADNFLTSIFTELFKDRVDSGCAHEANAPTKQTTAEDWGDNADLF